ncbi:MAG: DUF389 domain-containing protein [Solirubrobacterales bacterium]
MVGVLISVATIPAAANIGVAGAYGDWATRGAPRSSSASTSGRSSSEASSRSSSSDVSTPDSDADT